MKRYFKIETILES